MSYPLHDCLSVVNTNCQNLSVDIWLFVYIQDTKYELPATKVLKAQSELKVKNILRKKYLVPGHKDSP